MASRPWKNSSRLRHSESSLYASATRSGSQLFQASSAACTFLRADSTSNGGRMSVGLAIAVPLSLAVQQDRAVADGVAERQQAGEQRQDPPDEPACLIVQCVGLPVELDPVDRVVLGVARDARR